MAQKESVRSTCSAFVSCKIISRLVYCVGGNPSIPVRVNRLQGSLNFLEMPDALYRSVQSDSSYKAGQKEKASYFLASTIPDR